MRLQHISRTIGGTYRYQRRVPEALAGLYKQPWLRFSLKTRDLSKAIERAEVQNRELEALIESASPNLLYTKFLEQRARADDIAGMLDQYDPEQRNIVGRSLNPLDQARFFAVRKFETGQEPPARFNYGLRDACRDLLKVKEGRVAAKTLGKMQRAVNRFKELPEAADLLLIKRPIVVRWVEEQRKTHKAATVSDWVLYLGQMFQYAIDHGHLDEGYANPFKGHRMLGDKVTHYDEMHNNDLAVILKLLKHEDHMPAKIAWYSGMRLSEVLAATVVTVDDILCFKIAQGKTESAARTVPVHRELLQAMRGREKAVDIEGDYGKRFGRAKTKATGKGRELAFHSLRVSFINHAMRAGYPDYDVAKVVGHLTTKGLLETSATYYRGPVLVKLKEIVDVIPKLILK
jgi:integrase